MGLATILSLVALRLTLTALQPENACACKVIDLVPYVPIIRSAPAPDDLYHIRAQPGWNAVAIHSPLAADYDLYLYDTLDSPQATVSSTLGAGIIDIVLIDANHAPATDYFPTVKYAHGAGEYSIEWATNSEVLQPGTFGPYTVGLASVVRTWDMSLTANLAYHIVVSPTSGDADLSLAVFGSDPAITATHYQNRSQRLAESAVAGPGQKETVVFTPTRSDRFALVVWYNRVIAPTSYYVFLDATPPTGTLLINGGAEFTNSPLVTVTGVFTDEETGIADVCVSDEALIRQCHQPLAPISWTLELTNRIFLTNPQGLRSVSAQITNQAGLSSTISDTIVLDTISPTSVISEPANGARITSTPITIAGYAVDATSGISDVWVHIANDKGWSAAWPSSTPTWAYRLITTDGRYYTVTSQARDRAGNVEYPAASITFVVSPSVQYSIYLPVILYRYPHHTYLPIIAKTYLSGGCITTPNDSFSNAFGPLLPGVSYCGYLEDQYDFYYVEVSTPTRALITLQNQDLSPNYPPNNMLALYTPDHKLIDWCCIKRKHTISLGAWLTTPGKYYILVYAIDISSSLTYTLSWSSMQ